MKTCFGSKNLALIVWMVPPRHVGPVPFLRSNVQIRGAGRGTDYQCLRLERKLQV